MKWKLVPVEVTDEMATAWDLAYPPGVSARACAQTDLTAMLAASPDPLEDEELVEGLARGLFVAEVPDSGQLAMAKTVARAFITLLKGGDA